MRWSFPIAKVSGTLVQIHATFLILLAWIGGSYYLQGGLEAAVNGTIFILAVFGCVILHEFGHVLAAKRYGIPTPTITLLPIGGVARLQSIPEEPNKEFVIAIAGPLVNVAIAGILFAVLGGFPSLATIEGLEQTHYGIWDKLLMVNIVLVVFNLIPAFPMDGGRVLRSLLAMKLDYLTATQIAASTGQMLAIGFGFLGLFGNPLLLLIAFFVYLGAGQEAGAVELREATRGFIVSEAATRAPTFGADTPIREVLSDLLDSPHRFALVVDHDRRPTGVITREAVFRAVGDQKGDQTLRALMQTDFPVVAPSESITEALTRINDTSSALAVVTSDEGKYAGILTGESIGELIMLKRSPTTPTPT